MLGDPTNQTPPPLNISRVYDYFKACLREAAKSFLNGSAIKALQPHPSSLMAVGIFQQITKKR